MSFYIEYFSYISIKYLMILKAVCAGIKLNLMVGINAIPYTRIMNIPTIFTSGRIQTFLQYFFIFKINLTKGKVKLN
jgi:hypothetical protein